MRFLRSVWEALDLVNQLAPSQKSDPKNKMTPKALAKKIKKLEVSKNNKKSWIYQTQDVCFSVLDVDNGWRCREELYYNGIVYNNKIPSSWWESRTWNLYVFKDYTEGEEVELAKDLIGGLNNLNKLEKHMGLRRSRFEVHKKYKFTNFSRAVFKFSLADDWRYFSPMIFLCCLAIRDGV